MRLVALLSLVALVSCGADGEPEPREKREPGISVSGAARIGVSGSF